MRLEGRDLHEGLQGNDVASLQADLKLLGYELRREELHAQRFGAQTKSAVLDFQRKNGLVVNGVVSQVVVRLLNAAIDKLPRQPYQVEGSVRHQDRTPLPGVLVVAFERSPDGERKLAEKTTDERGSYRLSFTAEWSRAAGLHGPSLILRVFGTSGVEIAASGTVFQPPPVQTIDIVVNPGTTRSQPAFEALAEQLADDRRAFELTPSSIALLAGEAGVPVADVESYVQAARLAKTAVMPHELAWCLVLEGITNLDQLEQAPPERLQEIVRRAVKENRVSRRALQAVPGIERRIKRLREKKRPKPAPPEVVGRRLVAQIVRDSNGEPLAGFVVEVFDMDAAGSGPLALGKTRTNADGFFSLPYSVPVHTTAKAQRFRLIVSGNGQKHTVEEQLRPDDAAQKAVRVPFEAVAEGETTLEEVSRLADFVIPRNLSRFLESLNIRTLEDVRAHGGIAHKNGLPTRGADAAVQAIEGHARLDALSSDRVLNQAMINRGYTSAGEIAKTSRAEFVSENAGDRGEYAAAEMHTAAKSVEAFAQNKAAWALTDPEWQMAPQMEPLQVPCGCDDCEAAVSPLAYLADLLRYTTDHVRRNNANITVATLQSMLGQPFGRLPVTCRLMDEKVRQVRIAVEVLRAWHQQNPPTQTAAARLREEERTYRWTAYVGLLSRLGTSFEEVRLARTLPVEERQALAQRLGLNLGAAPHMLDRLYLEPGVEGQPDFLNAIPESALAGRFGLRRTTGDPLAAASKSELVISKLAYLRDQWRAIDWPDDEPGPGEPTIDPDVVGPDDFRVPVQNAAGGFALWVNRRQWVDARLEEFRALRAGMTGESAGGIVAALIARMYEPVTHPAVSTSAWISSSPEAALDDIWRSITSGNGVAEAVVRVETDLRLTTEAFDQFMKLRRKAGLSSADPSSPELGEDEWEEVISILVQATKRAVFEEWRTEEQSASVTLDPRFFWRSLREPVEGTWPPAPTTLASPLVDPEQLDKRDLPENTAGERALELWKARATQLAVRRDELREIRLTQGFEAALSAALVVPGDPPLPDPASRLALLSTAKSGADPVAAEQAAAEIRQTFLLTVDQFERLMTVQVKSDDPVPQNRPSEIEWNEADALLVTAWKGKFAAPLWTTEETTAGLTDQNYWLVRKATLPKWRATAERRALWRRALDIRSRPSIIDPDLLLPEDFKDPVATDAAFSLFSEREEWVADRLNQLEGMNQTLDGFAESVSGVLSVPFAILLGTAEETKLGEDIEARLAQWNLSWAMFQRLIDLHASLFNNGQPGGQLLPSEWEEARSILVAVEKQRLRAAWRDEEEVAGLLRGPDSFVIPEKKPELFQLPLLPELPKWRASIVDRFDWQDTLASRIDQQDTVTRSVDDLISSTEASALPLLRDALLRRANLPGSIDSKTSRLEELLLIELRDSGCAITTRVSAAISTIQSLLFALRTGQSEETHPELSLQADDFDEEWVWMGEYAWWRAALFTFLYPENLLIPQLSKVQTPGLQNLISELRSNRRLTPVQACEAGNRYQEYFADVCQMQLRASCVTHATIYRPGKCGEETTEHCLMFLFGIGAATDSVYWSFYDPHDPTGYGHSFWHLVEGLTNVISIVGAVPSTTPDDKRYIFLFLIVMEEGEKRLAFTRYDLETRVWDGAVQTLDPPFDATDFEAVAYQRDYEDADTPPIICVRPKNGPMAKAILMRRLNPEHSDWAESDWTVLTGKLRGNSIVKLLALVRGKPGNLLLIVKDDDDKLVYRLVGDGEDGVFYDIDSFNKSGTTGATFIGAFRWPGEPASFAFWKTGGVVYYAALASSSVSYDISDLHDYDAWLDTNVGASLIWVGYEFPSVEYYIPTGIHMDAMTKTELKSFFPSTWEITVTNPDAILAIEVHLPATVTLIDHLLVLHDFLRGLREINQSLPGNHAYWWHYSEDAVAAVDGYLNNVCTFIDEDAGQAAFWENADSLSAAVFNNGLCAMLKILTKEEDTFTVQRSGPSSPQLSPQQDITRIARACNTFYDGEKGSSNMRLGLQTDTGPMRGNWQLDTELLSEISDSKRVAPDLGTPHTILSPGRSFARGLAVLAWNRALRWPVSELAYLREAWYFVPVHIGLQLQRASQYTAALDWFRVVFDYSLSEDNRPRSPLLVKDKPKASPFERPDEWLLDPLNPHGIALTRPGAYTRFTIQTIARCFLDFGDAEFTRDTAESVPRARLLYDSALDLLKSKKLKQTFGTCSDIIGSLEIDTPKPWGFALTQLQNSMRGVRTATQLASLVEDVRATLSGPGGWASRFAQARSLVAEARGADVPRSMEDVIQPSSFRNMQLETAMLAGSEIKIVAHASAQSFRHAVAVVSGLSETELTRGARLPWLAQAASADPDGVSSESMARALRSGSTAQMKSLKYDPVAPGRLASRAAYARVKPHIGLQSAMQLVPSYRPSLNFSFCIPSNPMIDGLRQKAETELFKIRNCRNIAGLERQLDPYAAPTDTITGLPSIGADGQLVLPGLLRFPPTPYRFRTLMDRAKQLVAHAQQLEAALLSALEKFDAESFHLLQARQQVQLTRAGVRLQQLRTQEAQDGVRLAELQQERAQLHVTHFEDLLSTGMTALERQSISMLETAAGFQNASAIMSFIAAAFQAASAAAVAPGPGAVSQALALTAGSFSSAGSGLSSMAAAMTTNSAILSMYASHERQMQEWEFQRTVAGQDVRIGAQNVKLSEDRLRVVGQEYAIAQLQADQAESTVEFLAKKFTNVELYDWISDVLEGVFSYFLQQATATAQAAAAQLAFERQENAPPYIAGDYWSPPSETSLGGPDGSSQSPDRRGMTGSARLLEDLFRLDQYAFDTDQRKLQLSKTFSLAHLAPIEFQRFRESGVMVFRTPLEGFDREFPGHYLRLIHSVRTSVIALIPPTASIAATLTAGGVSRVVVGGTIFQDVAVNHGPRSVALSSPRDATGMFTLDPQSELLKPFEGMGVDALWELRMPKAANLFDYRTIADVLMTIEYTALNSYNYYQQVIQTAKPTLSASRPFSFRHQFADQWYDLHNPEQTATPLIVRFKTVREDFPGNLQNLKIDQVALYFARANGGLFEVPVSHLHFVERIDGGSVGGGSVGGGSISLDGLISTLKGNAGSWISMVGKSPIGEWELALPNTYEIRNRFKNQEIEDILFVITYNGRTAEWPA